MAITYRSIRVDTATYDRLKRLAAGYETSLMDVTRTLSHATASAWLQSAAARSLSQRLVHERAAKGGAS